MQELESARALESSEVEYVPPMTKEEWYAFIFSNRFWAMTMTNISLVLLDPAFPADPWYKSVGKFLALEGAGFVTIRTIDRAAEKV